MQKFSKLTAKAVALDLLNIDTDMIIPKQFLKTIKRTGLGANLFHEMRFDIEGNMVKDFVLNKAEFADSKILIAGDNFGCGSSREHAPWSLIDFGISCIIAPSFADIFYNNCFKNGILPIILDKATVDKLMKMAQTPQEFSIDLKKNEILAPNGEKFNFEIDNFRKQCLIEGLDDIALTLKKEDKISNFESQNIKTVPWLYDK